MGRDAAGARRPGLPRVPLAPVAAAMVAGVLADRCGASTLSTAHAGGLAGLAGLAAWALDGRWDRGSAAAIVAGFALIGACWHHHRWTDLDADDLARGAWSVATPAWLRGALLDDPEPTREGGGPAGDRGSSRLVLAVTGRSDGRRWHAASGRVLAYLAGGASGLRAGDPVQVAGRLESIPGPSNPGEPDDRERWRARGVRLRMSVDPGGAWADPDGRPWPARRWLADRRAEARARLIGGVDPRIVPLAAALLLGMREGVDPDVNDAFARTGTAHLLAISGAHLQVLGAALWLAARALGVGRKARASTILALTVAYAGLVGFAPSVVRSATMTVMACLAVLVDLRGRPANLLAAAAIATLAWNPADLFDAGCQLSFVGVAALVWAVPAALAPLRRPVDPLVALIRESEPAWRGRARRVGRRVAEALVGSVVVWLLTAPIVAARFHLVSPIGVLMNLPLIPLTTAALLLAGSTLLLALVHPALALPTAWGCSLCLRLTEWFVVGGGAVPWGHRFVAGPGLLWPSILYALVAALALASAARRRSARPLGWAVAAWVAVGLVAGLRPPARPGAPEARVLAVGHGLAVVVRSPGGRTLLYDCGRMGDPHVGRRVIAPALWADGLTRIDVVVLSHADADHFDGLPDLLDRFAIGRVLVPPGFGGAGNPEADRLIGLIRARGVGVGPIAAGDRVDLGPGLAASAIHPPAGWRASAGDNERSVVLDLEAGGRHLLLTGDLDGAGLAEVAARPPPGRVDALLAPHHGGRSANPDWFHEWARPGVVLASQRRPAAGVRDALEAVADGGVPVLRTWSLGALLARWAPSGVEVTPFLGSGPATAIATATAAAPIPGLGAGLIAAGALLGAGLGLAVVAVEWGAWALVRPGHRRGPRAPEPAPWEPISAEGPDGTPLAGSIRVDPGSGGRTLVLLHGFAEDRSALLGRAEAMAGRGWTVALLDARGRGSSGGDCGAFGGLETGDLLGWIDALGRRVGPGMRLAAWGRSMGSIVALRAAAADPRVRALVLEAPYADLARSVAASLRRLRLPGALAPPMLARAGMIAGASLASPRPIDVAGLVAARALVVHGSADPVVAPSEARRLAAAIPGAGPLVEVPGARHADVFEVGGAPLLARIAAFLDAAVPPQSEAGADPGPASGSAPASASASASTPPSP